MVVPRSGPLRSALVELHLVDGPDGSFDVLHSHETLVQRQIVTHCVLFIGFVRASSGFFFFFFVLGHSYTPLILFNFNNINYTHPI
jgi:hypothetical protein